MRTRAEIRLLNGYRVVLRPEHPKAMTSKNWYGYVYEHIIEAEKKLGRPLIENEVVHHTNGDRGDNRHENLSILTRSEHTKEHARLAGRKVHESTSCPICGYPVKGNSTYCSKSCSRKDPKYRKVERPSKNQLLEDVRTMSVVQVGKKYGVSDNAIRKWLKAYGAVA